MQALTIATSKLFVLNTWLVQDTFLSCPLNGFHDFLRTPPFCVFDDAKEVVDFWRLSFCSVALASSFFTSVVSRRQDSPFCLLPLAEAFPCGTWLIQQYFGHYIADPFASMLYSRFSCSRADIQATYCALTFIWRLSSNGSNCSNNSTSLKMSTSLLHPSGGRTPVFFYFALDFFRWSASGLALKPVFNV